MDYYWKPDLINKWYKNYNNTIPYVIPIIVTPLSQEEFIKEGFIKRWHNEHYTEEYYKIEGIYTFGNLDFTCFNNTDKKRKWRK